MDLAAHCFLAFLSWDRRGWLLPLKDGMYTQEPLSLLCPLDLPSMLCVSRGSPGSVKSESGDGVLFPALRELLVRTKALAFPGQLCSGGTMCFSTV